MSDETEAGDAPPNPATDPADAAVARSAVAAGSASLFVGLLGLVPFAWVLPLLPMTRDATIWVDRSSWQHPKLHEWLVDTQHFNVGFRPVTGLSYLLNDLAGGGLLAYRITDFGLHLAVVLLVHGLVRSWAPRRTPWAATAAAAASRLRATTWWGATASTAVAHSCCSWLVFPYTGPSARFQAGTPALRVLRATRTKKKASS